MRRDVYLLAALYCSLLDRCAARLAHCFREGQVRHPVHPKSRRRLAAQRTFHFATEWKHTFYDTDLNLPGQMGRSRRAPFS